SQPALKALLEYDWPGNVRQLRNIIERAIVLSEIGEITLDVLPQEILRKSSQKNDLEISADIINISASLDFKEAKREFERKYIERCLDQTSGNITQAASILGMHRQSLQ